MSSFRYAVFSLVNIFSAMFEMSVTVATNMRMVVQYCTEIFSGHFSILYLNLKDSRFVG
jgi:hypothetical protein